MPDFIEVEGLRFRDLDHDGELAPYEDWRRSAEERADDLLQRMSTGEKVGLLLHGTVPAVGGPLGVLGIGPEYDLQAAETLIADRGVNSMITRLALEPRAFAAQNNAVQAIAARTRLGIPVTISSDPRHHFNPTHGASVAATGFSQWPGTLGLAALGDRDTTCAFGDVVRQEYRATGLHMALSPQADLATSPRWARIDGTFGEDPALVRKLVGAYVEGVQGGTTGAGSDSVAAVVKHWVGYGAAPDGFDGHNYYGRFSSFPGGAFDSHVEAFLDALEMDVAAVMPTYNILQGFELDGQLIEQVGAGYCHTLLEGLLRRDHGFTGVVLSDWAIARDVSESCRTGEPRMQPQDISMAWGVEDLSLPERFAKGINAGLDQFGGEDDPEPILNAVAAGLVSERRIDESARRVLLQKFRLGLFEQPFVDAESAAEVVGGAGFAEAANAAQRRSMVVLEKPEADTDMAQQRLYLRGIDAGAFEAKGLSVVANLDDASLAVVRLGSPSELLHSGFFFGSFQKEGDLDFKEDAPEFVELKQIAARVPTVVIVDMDRPPILTNVQPHARMIIATYGVSDEAIADVVAEPALARGKLPYALPRSMAAVEAQMHDRPLDDPEPLYAFGYSVVP